MRRTTACIDFRAVRVRRSELRMKEVVSVTDVLKSVLDGDGGLRPGNSFINCGDLEGCSFFFYRGFGNLRFGLRGYGNFWQSVSRA